MPVTVRRLGAELMQPDLSAADRGEVEEALLVDVGDDESDFVDVADHGQQGSFVVAIRRGDGGDARAQTVGGDLRESGRLAPDIGGGRFITGGSGSAEQFVEQRGSRRHEAIMPRLLCRD